MHKIKQIIKGLIGTKYFLKLSKGNRFIFVYHDISNQDSSHFSKHYSTPVELFKAHMSLFKSMFEMVPLEEIVTNNNLNSKKNYAAITFDDGFSSVVDNAAPILDQLSIPYSIFINGSAVEHNQIWISNIELSKDDERYPEKLLQLAETSIKGKEDPIRAIVNRGFFSEKFKSGYRKDRMDSKVYLDRNDIVKLNARKVQIGNHSYDHFVLSLTSAEETRKQIVDNHQLLSTLLRKDVKHFAIPFGRKENFTEATIRELRAMNYTSIYTTNPNRFRAKDLAKNNFLFPRIVITAQTTKQLLFYINHAIIRTSNL